MPQLYHQYLPTFGPYFWLMFDPVRPAFFYGHVWNLIGQGMPCLTLNHLFTTKQILHLFLWVEP